MISPTDYQGRYEELKRIIRAEWNPAERIAALALMVQAWEGDSVDRLGKWTQVGNGGATDVAEIAGISRSTANNIINKFVGVGIVSREVSKTPVNRFGEEIPARKMNPDNGDRWQNISTIAVLAKLPDVLPALAETAYTAKQRTKATIARRLATIARELKTTPCPHCGVVGDLQAALESNSSTQQRDTFAEHEAAFIAGLTDEQLAQHLVALTQVLAECESPKIMALVETCTLQSVC